jgi:hypothetical protein
VVAGRDADLLVPADSMTDLFRCLEPLQVLVCLVRAMLLGTWRTARGADASRWGIRHCARFGTFLTSLSSAMSVHAISKRLRGLLSLVPATGASAVFGSAEGAGGNGDGLSRLGVGLTHGHCC